MFLESDILLTECYDDIYRYDFREDDHDYYTQTGMLYIEDVDLNLPARDSQEGNSAPLSLHH